MLYVLQGRNRASRFEGTELAGAEGVSEVTSTVQVLKNRGPSLYLGTVKIP